MLTSHLRKFTELYDTFGLGVAKKLCLLTLIVIKARTVSLWKLKDYVGAELGNTDVQSSSIIAVSPDS